MRQKPIQRLEATARSVSKVRFRPANPFEHKRNFERGGTGFGVCDRVMAEEMRFELTVGVYPLQQFSKLPPSATRPPLRRESGCTAYAS